MGAMSGLLRLFKMDEASKAAAKSTADAASVKGSFPFGTDDTVKMSKSDEAASGAWKMDESEKASGALYKGSLLGIRVPQVLLSPGFLVVAALVAAHYGGYLDLGGVV